MTCGRFRIAYSGYYGPAPHWQTVYYYFDQINKVGLLEHINAAVNQLGRQQQGRKPLSSTLCIDSQSVKLAPLIFEHRGGSDA